MDSNLAVTIKDSFCEFVFLIKIPLLNEEWKYIYLSISKKCEQRNGSKDKVWIFKKCKAHTPERE